MKYLDTAMITCFLDSQDYSALTDPKQDSPSLRQIKKSLLNLAESKQIHFVFSTSVICESVALTPETTHLAEMKAEFLSALCGTNALISIDRLVEAEIRALADNGASRIVALDPHGRWYPDIDIDVNTQPIWNSLLELAVEKMKSAGLSREQRRANSRLMIKNGKPTPALRSQIGQLDISSFASDLMNTYPMRPDHAEVMVRYTLGKATEKEFHDAFTSSLKDPLWMMKWFSSQHSLSSPIAETIRKPGREIGHAMRKLAEANRAWTKALLAQSPDARPTSKTGVIYKRWQEMERQQLTSLVQRLAKSFGIGLKNVDSDDVIKYCPGLSTSVRSMYSSLWENVGGSRAEEASDSQSVDSIHALYAPYVDIFRADRFMTPHIEKFVNATGTIVVPRLANLVQTLEDRVS